MMANMALVSRGVNENFTFNKETEFVPILGLAAEKLNGKKDGENTSESLVDSGAHHPALLSLLSNELSIAPETIVDMELSLYDSQPATLGEYTLQAEPMDVSQL